MRSLSLTVFFLFCLFFSGVQGQISHRSIHQEQSEKYAHYSFESEKQWDSLQYEAHGITKPAMQVQSVQACTLNKRVFGWNPYWAGSAYNNYQWNLLSDLCHFSYEVDAATGNATSTHNWATDAAVTAAKNNGVKIHLCATLFSSHATFLGSSTAQNTFITNIISLLNSRGANGVNIDFEGVPSAQSANLTAFMINLCNQVHAANASYEVSIALPAVDWSAVYDVNAMKNYVDLFIIMGYDYYYSGSTTAGPSDPLFNFQTSYNYTLTKSISYYLNKNVPNAKLLLGLPYYGEEWPTSALTVPSATTGSGSARFFYDVKANVNGYYSNPQWDANSYSVHYAYNNGSNRQLFINSGYSLGKRFDIVNQFGIGGIGIWALSYDNGYSDYWDAIKNKFSDCGTVACTDTLFDMGGPNRNYYDNEKYIYTIAPAGASSVSLAFSSFASELNFDSLWVYNGSSTASPLLGAYTGTITPGTVSSTGPTMTIRWKSDGATQSSGWYAIWNCSADNVAPTTIINTPNGWITQDFTTSFTDGDNFNGSGLQKSFYSVSDFDGTEWRANNTRGFFNDHFNTSVHPEWTAYQGTWAINGNALEQSDETNANTSISAALTQNLSNRYLYHWKGKISGTQANRRAGFHFACDSASLPNRGNSYFVWFRVDQSQMQFYKVVNDTFYLKATFPITITAGTWYDYKVIYDRINGKMEMYQDNNYIGTWTDPAPYANGKYVSFRSGNAIYGIDDFEVFRSRNTSLTVTVGSAGNKDIRFQSPNPVSPSGNIKSIVYDNAGNLSGIATQTLMVDWTSPSPCNISDGTAADIDTSYDNTQLSANWTTAVDTNSGVVSYWYAIGTNAGDSNTVAWTNNNTNTSVTHTGLSLTYYQKYYFSVRTVNGAGLVSFADTSDGQLVLDPLSTANILSASPEPGLFPNPAHGSFYVSGGIKDILMIAIYNITGELIWSSMTEAGKRIQPEPPLTGGVYLVKITSSEGTYFRKLVIE